MVSVPKHNQSKTDLICQDKTCGAQAYPFRQKALKKRPRASAIEA